MFQAVWNAITLRYLIFAGVQEKSSVPGSLECNHPEVLDKT